MECLCVCIAIFVIWKLVKSGTDESATKVIISTPPLRPRTPVYVAPKPAAPPLPTRHPAYVCRSCGAQNPGGGGPEGTCGFCGTIHKP